MYVVNHCIKTLAAFVPVSREARKDPRRKSKGQRRRERANRFAAWLMDVQDNFSDCAR